MDKFLSPQERVDLLRLLNKLPSSVFDEIRIGMNVPTGLLPIEGAALSRRTVALFDWVRSPIGPGEVALKTFVDKVVAHYRENLLLSGSEDNEQQPIRIELLNSVSLDLVHIPAGRFLMGSLEDELDREASEGPHHQVTVSGCYIGVYPVTQAQWSAVAAMATVDISLSPDPSFCKGRIDEVSQDGNRPVETVSWYEAVEFCNRITTAMNQSEQYRNYRCRLPTEAEWEYACRAGSQTRYCSGAKITPEYVNHAEAVGQTTPVGTYPSNAFGLFDMHGNVWEWCCDPWHGSYQGAPHDGRVWEQGGSREYRVIRGGSWINDAKHCRSAYRNCLSPSDRSVHLGFRIVLVKDSFPIDDCHK